MLKVEKDDPFFGCYSKIRRAETSLQSLRGAVQDYFSSVQYEIFEQDVGNNLVHIVLKANTPVSDEIYHLSSEITYHLRSVLDQMVSAIAKLDENKSRNICFPFVQNPMEFNRAAKEKLKGFSVEFIEMVRIEEPWCDGKGKNLWALSKLSNIDKHNSLIPMSAPMGFSMIGGSVNGGGHPDSIGYNSYSGDLIEGYVVSKIGKNGHFIPGKVSVKSYIGFGSKVDLFYFSDLSKTFEHLIESVFQLLGRFYANYVIK